MTEEKQTPLLTSDFTVGRWLDLHGENPEEAGEILETLSRRAAARIPRRRWDADDAAHDALVRALADDCAALRRVEPPGTPLLAWLRGCIRNLRREKEKEKENFRLDELPAGCSTPSALAEIHEDEQGVISQLDSLPPPYRMALYLRLALDMTFREIREKLTTVHPVSLGHTARIVLEAKEMFNAAQAGEDPRRRWPGRYNPEKNPWIGRKTPPLPPYTL